MNAPMNLGMMLGVLKNPLIIHMDILLNIDFSIGLGYMGGEYKEYLPQDGHYVWQSTKRRHWIGPTKAEISLVWLIGRGNTNKTK